MNTEPDFGFVLPHLVYWGWLAIMPLIFIPWARWQEARQPQAPTPDEKLATELLAEEDPALHVETGVTRVIDALSKWSGIFVAFWTVNAVVAYFYEVIMRYVFNQPTIWVHESCFLLFGMQYLLAGAYTLLTGGHVRVDVLYIKLPPRGRVGMDIFTSVFFFIFAIALFGTSWGFFMSSYGMGETTVETWGIQYWPVKATMVIGASLLLLAGISKLIKDIVLFRRMGREG
ncbi:TRAP transporter small permease subunit [Denitromonas iodatirespirans]|uniref:TRAP transporter small permease protein n=1 Tax=Denitromonas iodatirespirans TaxID=2795389 RepID=A0A944HAB4_DENI1|nr:TRAP transporter small permease subunit [Denitromonas iodatirespirans]MBT0963295.1 TRAP transporter small permease subunit [Denitromonas iodatirespirans]